MEILVLFLKIFIFLILMFLGVVAFYVYPVNILYNNEKFTTRGEPKVLFVWSLIFVALIDCLLYYFYNYSTNYLCTVSKYIPCTGSVNGIAVYVLMLIHLLVTFGFTYFFMNYLYGYVKTKRLDNMLFTYAVICMAMIIINREIYNNLYSNMNIIYYVVRGLINLVTLSPLYSFLILNLLTKIEFKKKKPVKKKEPVKEEKKPISSN